jgi:Family of unknown function (DUF6544)
MSHIKHNDELVRLQHAAQEQGPSLITAAQVLDLPAPVKRYLNYAQVVGKEPIRTVRLKQQGFFRQQPGQKWFPMVAEQYFTTTPPAFNWHAKMRLFPLVWISATDRLSDGHGSMRIKPLALFTVANARGPEMDQSSALRYLAEMIWFPTAWLSDYIQWQAIDAHSVKAIYHEPGVTVSAVLHVNEQGQPTQFTTDRFMDEHGRYRLTPWSGQSNEYREVDGMRIPTKIEVTWHLASGEFSYFRCKITEIEYNQSGKVMRF